jgi:hypothetical protein
MLRIKRVRRNLRASEGVNRNMSKRATRKSPRKSALFPGPKPETLRIEGDWKDALKSSLAKKKLPEGWPKYWLKSYFPLRDWDFSDNSSIELANLSRENIQCGLGF